ncbi:MAG: Flp family type IVb pilin [Gammaproteobacteria bacterium]|nr:Flp family type IVb pilin [Gammaproteobacteria bacterium]
MNKFVEAVKTFVRDEEGLTVVEYAVAGGVLAGAIVLAFSGFGTAVKDKIDAILS